MLGFLLDLYEDDEQFPEVKTLFRKWSRRGFGKRSNEM
jgi:hypothetical protein